MADTPSQRPEDKDSDSFSLNRRELLMGAGGVLLAGSLAACGSGGSSGTTASSAAGTPKRGGNFRLAVTGGGAKDMMDGQNIITKPDQARLMTAFETLLVFDTNYHLQNHLAEEVTQNKPDQWTIVLKKGIEFSNGKTLTADDVVYSLNRLIDPKNGLYGAAGFASLKSSGIKKLNSTTVQLNLSYADAGIAEQLGQYYNGIVPEGYEAYPAPQHGTGGYILKSFTPGQQSVHTRNPNYWQSGKPYFDQVTITDFTDATAQVNALQAGQADAMTDLPFGNVSVIKGHPGLSVLISKTGGWLPLCMAIDMPPFTDNRVREAFRLMVDRQQMVEQVLSGYGTIANDLYSPFDPAYNHSLPQREQDVDKAKSLLKQAGQDGMTVDLHTTNGAAGMVDVANVFATQAKASGVTVNVHNDPNYYGDSYLKLAFSIDFWGTRNYLPQVANGSIPGAPYNETHWPPKSGPGSNFLDLYHQALTQVDESKRVPIIHEMQALEYNYGGYIIPFFNDLVDAYSSKVAGFEPSKGTLNLTSFGNGYTTIWFA
ncbi:MAG TPA: ABC transporter substrate-binding protein [Gaiellales bacterium]|jgi:peptide/nickel transport system substrate-binding protein|nr:ABC transporter substrate-binding protein [Gaiellales bacterium]